MTWNHNVHYGLCVPVVIILITAGLNCTFIYRYYLAEKTKSQTTAPEFIAEQLRLQEEDLAKCFQINEEWNKEVARIREKRVADKAERKRLQVLEEVEDYKQKEEELLKQINEMVRIEKVNIFVHISNYFSQKIFNITSK